MSDERLPEAVSESRLAVGGMVIRAYILEDGSRIIDADDVEAFLEALEAGSVTLTQAETDAFGAFMHGDEAGGLPR